MIELNRNELVFRFPEVHPKAKLSIDLQRTLRIPDDGKVHYLPPGLGSFPLRHVDDFAERIPAQWRRHGGVMLPMYQSEAMWVYFNSVEIEGHWVPYPFAVKIAAGKIDAVTGQDWTNGLHPNPQDYMVVPEQPWLDGFCVEKGVIRQFVAMPLGAGYTAEEQLKGTAATRRRADRGLPHEARGLREAVSEAGEAWRATHVPWWMRAWLRLPSKWASRPAA